MPDATLLIVDDEVELAENLADLLEFEGYGVEMCLSGEEALQKVASNMPDLVLLDIKLPGIDGIEVLRRLKEAHPTLPVVMIRASSQQRTREKIEKYGADALVLKPYDQDDLLKLVDKFLRRSMQ